MTIRTQEKAVNVIYRDDEMICLFTRDDKSNKNLFFATKEASLDEIAKLFVPEEKIKPKESVAETPVSKKEGGTGK